MAAVTRRNGEARAVGALLVIGALVAARPTAALPAYTDRDWPRLTRWALESPVVRQFTGTGWRVDRTSVEVRGFLFSVDVRVKPPDALAARGLDEVAVSVYFPQEAAEAQAAERNQAGFDAAWSRLLADRRFAAFEAQGSARIIAHGLDAFGIGRGEGFNFHAYSEVGAERRTDYLSADVRASGTTLWVSARSWARRLRYVLYLPWWIQLGIGAVLLAIGARALGFRAG